MMNFWEPYENIALGIITFIWNNVQLKPIKKTHKVSQVKKSHPIFLCTI
jgi:hypothetical protein